MRFTYESYQGPMIVERSSAEEAWGKDYLKRYKGRYTHNVATTSPQEARRVAERMFSAVGLDLDTELPDFDRNYTQLKAKMRHALPIPRDRMPVIEPDDIGQFEQDIRAGNVDIFSPHADMDMACAQCVPGDPFPWQHSSPPMFGDIEWTVLGQRDGDPNDDKLRAPVVMRAVKTLKPLQGEIWFDKCIASIIAFGVPEIGGFLATSATIIVSSDDYILDGHHRFGQGFLATPNFTLKSLVVPLDINTLLKVGRSYGSALGNPTKK